MRARGLWKAAIAGRAASDQRSSTAVPGARFAPAARSRRSRSPAPASPTSPASQIASPGRAPAATERAGRLPERRRRDRELAPPREVAADDRCPERAHRGHLPAGQRAELVVRHVSREHQRREHAERRGPHRREIAHRGHRRAGADVLERQQIATEVHTVNGRVDRPHERAEPAGDDGRVVADPQKDRRVRRAPEHRSQQLYPRPLRAHAVPAHVLLAAPPRSLTRARVAAFGGRPEG